jgi:hypothetical protein
MGTEAVACTGYGRGSMSDRTGVGEVVGSVRDAAAFMDTGLDWRLDDRFSPTERDRLLDWYRTHHGDGELDLVAFAPFLIDQMPAAFKLTRRHVQATMQGRDGVQLPAITNFLFNISSFPSLGFAKGIKYELIGARSLGASRALVMDVLEYAYLSAGPRGMNAVAELSDDYLRQWLDPPDLAAIEWPEGWAPDPQAFRSGIDHDTPGLTDTELRALSAWHQRNFGLVPRSVELFGRLHPEAYKLQRIRYEKAIGTVMPAQLAPLLTLHLATIKLQPLVMRQAVHQARVLGVRRHHVVQTLFGGMRQMLVDPMVTEAVADAVADELAGWPA